MHGTAIKAPFEGNPPVRTMGHPQRRTHPSMDRLEVVVESCLNVHRNESSEGSAGAGQVFDDDVPELSCRQSRFCRHRSDRRTSRLVDSKSAGPGAGRHSRTEPGDDTAGCKMAFDVAFATRPRRTDVLADPAHPIDVAFGRVVAPRQRRPLGSSARSEVSPHASSVVTRDRTARATSEPICACASRR